MWRSRIKIEQMREQRLFASSATKEGKKEELMEKKRKASRKEKWREEGRQNEQRKEGKKKTGKAQLCL